MSYCVNCGVELGASEKHCPLCGVEVINPAVRFDAGAEKPFPMDIEKVRHKLVRIAAARILGVLLAIPFISILLVDLVQDGALTWSLIPASAIALAFMLAVFPCLFSKPRVWFFILMGTLEIALFLFVLLMILGGNWYYLFALPITLLTGAALTGGCLIITARKVWLPLKVIIVFLILMVYVIVLQMLIEIYLRGRIKLDWSLYAGVSCGLLSLAALIVGRLVQRNENFRKQMFF